LVTASPTIGTVLANRYQVLRPLGRGGMGAVYLARDLRFTRRFVALKENADRSPAAQAQFRLEAEVLATLHHPHLPAVTDHFTTPDGRQFLVMDYVEGENLEERVMREGPLPEGQVLAWADQVLDALAYLHAQSPPVIHRDVKPANVRLTPAGEAVLVDFGITKHLVPGQPTATVARAGSPGYAPIEQYAGGTDQRSDIYSLGATLYFALTGQVPPEAPLLAAGQTLPHPRQFNPAISRRTEAAILRAMQTDAGRRFQSAAEMRAALRGETIRSRGKGRWKTAAGIGGIAVVVLLCLLLAWLGRGYGSRLFTATPTYTPTPTATATAIPTATTTTMPAVVPPTDTAPPGAPTSTPRPTTTPTYTPRPPTITPTPMPTATSVPPTPTTGGGGGGGGGGGTQPTKTPTTPPPTDTPTTPPPTDTPTTPPPIETTKPPLPGG